MSASNRPPSVYVDDVFEEVLALPSDQREEAILARCAGHPSLAAEVRQLLEAEESLPQPESEVVKAGAKLGRYHLDTCLGKGASASVWKAWDTHLRTWTALKLIHSDIRHREDALQTVLHEARAASAIISDHVVRIKAAGKIPRGPYYVEMQLCAEQSPDSEGQESLVVGRTLAEEPPRSVREAARLVMEAARGAEAAHRVGVLHRDIKPANILLMPVSRRALVADFGLSAANMYPEPTPGTPSTATVTIHLRDAGRVLVGTPSYMPPEQAWGDPATRANDIYALGATLYALIARRAPYQSTDARPRTALQVVEDVRAGPPRPLEWAAERVPGQLVRIVNRAMSRNAQDRYPTAAALAEDLQCFLADRPTSVDGYRPWLRAGLGIKRWRGVVATTVTMGGILSISLGGVVALELRRSELKAENAALEEQTRQALTEAAKAEDVRATAVTERVAAEAQRDAADAERDAAVAARDQAKRGQTMAERIATREIQARKDADEARNAAVQLKLEAEEELARLQGIRESLDAELTVQRQAVAEQQARARWLEGELSRELTAKLELEGDIEALDSEILDLRARLGMLETELDLANARVEQSEQGESAPWMGEESVPAVEQP